VGYNLPSEHEEGIQGYFCIPVPSNEEYRQALVGTLTWITKWYAWERTGDDRGAIAAHYLRWLITPAIYDILDSCGCSDDCEDCRSGGGENLPDCITIDEKGNICIEGENCMGDIYIYNGCGCGCGTGCQSTGSVGSGDNGTGSLSGQPDLEGSFTPGGDRVTLCDTATSLVPYLISQFREFVNTVDSTLDAGGDLVDLIGGTTIGAIDLTDISNNTIEFLSDLLGTVAEPAIDVFDDSDFVLRAQEIWWSTFSGRTDWTSVSRDDIRLWASRLPITWGNILTAQAVSPRLVAYSIAAILDMPKVNRQLRVAKGTAETGLCEYLASQNGETFTPNPTVEPPFSGEIVTISGWTFYVIEGELGQSSAGGQIDIQPPPGVTTYDAIAVNHGQTGSGNYTIDLLVDDVVHSTTNYTERWIVGETIARGVIDSNDELTGLATGDEDQDNWDGDVASIPAGVITLKQSPGAQQPSVTNIWSQLVIAVKDT
jgi:hypothetical protein